VTASRRSLAAPLALAGLLAGGGCAGPAALPLVSAIDQNVALPARVPDLADRTAARLAAAALGAEGARGHAEVERALASLEAIDRTLVAIEDRRTGLVPAAHDLANASLDDHRAYRRATEELLDQDLDAALEARLELFQADDFLALAGARIRDARQIEFARAFNTLAEPAGRSMLNFSMAPYRFGQALLQYAIEVYQTEALPLQRRQALAHWKSHLARHPDDPRAEELARRIADGQAAWNRTQRDRMVKAAEDALQAERPRRALVYSDRALRFLPEDEKASDLRDRAEERLLEERERRRRSLSADPGATAAELAPPGARELCLALLAPGGDVAAASRAFLERDREGSLADEARFAAALARAEAGDERGAWDELEALADLDGERSNMARHAAHLIGDPETNPYGAFQATRRNGQVQRLRFALLGPWANGPPERGLPDLLEWPLGAPQLSEAAMGLPLRLIQLPWIPTHHTDAAASSAARRYLAQHPEGARAEELRGWLLGYEKGRGNWLSVLALEEERLPPDAPELADLREKAAAQSLEVARKEVRPSLRLALLRHAAREYPGTEAGQSAGLLAREQTLRSTPQRIQLSRGFLLENPEVAGVTGLALGPGLLDGSPSNGELHPTGVAFVGGAVLELSLVSPDGDADDPPVHRLVELEAEHLARAVALLEETTFRNALVDTDDVTEPDARRDRFFEQARLGLAHVVDPRPDAGSGYVYRGLRERYGLVRAREAILPFDIVVQGSFTDLSLGAFPRIRRPRETPDAVYYK
jgi:hypothetical protein